jgi:hypothetical protein
MRFTGFLLFTALFIYVPAFADETQGDAAKPAPLAEYISCGCGCCGGVEPQDKCVYKILGDSLEKIAAEDKAHRPSARQCALMGCAIGTRYHYCSIF